MWLAPTASYSNRVTFTEAAPRAMEACKMIVNSGLTESWAVERSQRAGSPWAFNTALDSVVFAIAFGVVANEPCSDAGMLQIRLAGTAPDVGEYHYAFPSDCFPWSSTDGMFVMDDEVSDAGREAVCSTLASDWRNLESAYARGESAGCARWVPGCPVRVPLGGVGGNRLLVLTPEQAPWDLRYAVTSNHRNARLASMVAVAKLESPTKSLAQRAEQPAAGGNIWVYSPNDRSARELPSMWSPRTMRVRGVGPSANSFAVEEE